jgi:hypothetical protein
MARQPLARKRSGTVQLPLAPLPSKSNEVEGEIVPPASLLSFTKKMPGASFSLPARRTCPSSRVSAAAHGAAASCAVCYACRGRYRIPSNRSTAEARLRFIIESWRRDRGDSWVAHMMRAMRDKAKQGSFFRIHDSGDFFSPWYVDLWTRVCLAAPGVRFWAPTLEHLRADTLARLRVLAAVPGVSIRPSAPRRDTPPPRVAGLAAGSAIFECEEDVPEGVHVCPATRRGAEHSCLANECLTCWTRPEVPVAYLRH